MSSPYTIDLNCYVVLKLQSNGVYLISTVSVDWGLSIDDKFWMNKFIRDYGARLPKGVNYKTEYVYVKRMSAERLSIYALTKGYTKLVYSLVSRVGVFKLLPIAAEKGNIDVVAFLLANGADIHIQENEALIQATKKGNLEIVTLLINNGADIHARNNEALIIAAKHYNTDIFRLLLLHGANTNNLVLSAAIDNDNVEVVKILMDKGMNIDTVLEYATKSSSLNIFKLLVNIGANICPWINKALIIAAQNNKLELVEFLLANGADIHNLKCAIWK